MLNLNRELFLGFLLFGLIGCSDPEAQAVDMNEVVAESGLAEDEYTVHENGAIEIHSESEDKTEINPNDPLAAQGDNWEYVVKNGIRTADEYAVKNNPAATFIGKDLDTGLDKQYGGDYEGDYLLTILNDNPGNINYAQLRPLFDINSPSDTLDDESVLWEVTIAKHNGKEF